MKGNHRTIKAKAVFFNRLGEMRDRSFESQRLSGQRPQPAGGCHHSLEHSLLG